MRVSSSTSIGWLNLDAWSETYLGAWWLITHKVPAHIYQMEPHDGPLCQLTLISAQQLVEIALFRSIRQLIDQVYPGDSAWLKRWKNCRFQIMLKNWPVEFGKTSFDLEGEPCKSVIRLSNRRNETVHHLSALTTPAMARSALFTGVEASRAIVEHLLGAGSFKYDAALTKYPLGAQPWFSAVEFPPTPKLG